MYRTKVDFAPGLSLSWQSGSSLSLALSWAAVHVHIYVIFECAYMNFTVSGRSNGQTSNQANKWMHISLVRNFLCVLIKEFSCFCFRVSTMKVPLLFVSCLCYFFGPAAPSHFRGGIIQWRPVNSRAFDGEVSFCAITMLLEPLMLCWRYAVGPFTQGLVFTY